jgi:hypothetical protein
VLLLRHLSFSDLNGKTVGPLGITMVDFVLKHSAQGVLCFPEHAGPFFAPVKRTIC